MSNYKKIILIFCSIIFITLLCLYLFYDLKFIDEFFYSKIISLKSDMSTDIFKFFTFLGSTLFIIILMILVLIFNKNLGIKLLISVIIVTIVNNLIKILICRDRPIDINLITETGYSFPSGHSITSVSSYGLLLYYLLLSKINKNVKKILIFILCIIMLMVPISRVYLGVHYFSDVVAGACLGIDWIILYTWFIEKKKNVK